MLDFITRIAVSIGLGFLIGLERQLTGHSSGIRINVLVSLGSTIFVLFSALTEAPDPTRIAAQIVTGVGFLCSGIIFKDGAGVRGLNTAATIWCTAAIGVLSSSGKLLFAFAATVLLLLSNLLFRTIAPLVAPLDCFYEGENTYRVTVVCPQHKELRVRSTVMHYLEDTRLTLANLESAGTPDDHVEIQATLLCGGRRRDDAAERLIRKVSLEEDVVRVGWEMI